MTLDQEFIKVVREALRVKGCPNDYSPGCECTTCSMEALIQMLPPDLSQVSPRELFAWVGEDEFGSGTIGLKQAVCPAGTIPMVAVRRDKMDDPNIAIQFQMIANVHGKTIRLVRFVPVDVIRELKPGTPV